MNLLQQLFLLSLALFLSGCATVEKAAFDHTTETLAFSEKSYVVMNLTMDHAVKPKYHPNNVMIVHVERPKVSNKSDRINLLLKKADLTNDKGNPAQGVVRGSLAPGEYLIKGITATSMRFPIVGTFNFLMNTPFTVKENEVVYLGDMTVTTRKREEGEFRAGALIPLLDQAVSGIAGSTADVSVIDGGEIAINRLKNAFPVLNSHQIETRLVPSFNRSEFDKDIDEKKE